MMISQKHTKPGNLNVPGKSHLKRQITHEKVEPLNKSIKICDKGKVKLNNMKKADLIKHCQDLLVKNNILMKEKETFIKSEKEHLKTIEGLEENIKKIKHDLYHCGECDYIADCVHDWNDHTHTPEDLHNDDFSCKFCDESFETMPDVMRHNKLVHTSLIQHCKNFLESICPYGDSCWFLHSESFRNSEPSFECNYCEKKFLTKNALCEHKKKLHPQSVSKCKSEVDCKFGPKKCWFIHQKDIVIAYDNTKSKGQM